MSNHSLTARGTELPFSHKSVMSTAHEQNIICSKTPICRQLFADHVMGSRPMKTKDNTSNDNKQLLDEVEHDIMIYQKRGLCYLPKPKAEADNTDTRF